MCPLSVCVDARIVLLFAIHPPLTLLCSTVTALLLCHRLEKDLAAAAANPAVRWIVAGGHRPFEDFDYTAVAALFKVSPTRGTRISQSWSAMFASRGYI